MERLSLLQIPFDQMFYDLFRLERLIYNRNETASLLRIDWKGESRA
jgi:hypothetical protein